MGFVKSILGKLKKGKIAKHAESSLMWSRSKEYFFATRTSQTHTSDTFLYNETIDDSAKCLFFDTWDLIYKKTDKQGGFNSHEAVSYTQGGLTAYIYAFADGRVDWMRKPIYSMIGVVMSNNDAKTYTLEDFVKEIFAKKAEFTENQKTAFDLALKFPIVWKNIIRWHRPYMESSDKQCPYEHKTPFYTKETVEENVKWQESTIDSCIITADVDKAIEQVTNINKK